MAAVQAKRKRRAIASSDEEINEAEPKKEAMKKAPSRNATDSNDISSKPMHPMFAKKSAPVKDDLPSSDLRSSPAPGLLSGSEAEADEEAKEDAKLAKKIAKVSDSDLKPGGGWGQWKEGDPLPYSALTSCFTLIESTTKRLLILSYLTDFLRLVLERRPDEFRQVIWLCINRLVPDYEGIELGLGEGILLKAIAESTGRKVDKIREAFRASGDLGLTAQESRNMQSTMFRPKPLTVSHIYKALMEIAKTTGQASQSKKIGIINKLLACCNVDDNEAKFLVRSLEGKSLRIGLAERTVVVALAHAFVWREEGASEWSATELAEHLEEGSAIVRQAYSALPNYDFIIPALLEHGIKKLPEHCKLTPGVPLKPMLAKPTKAISEVLDRFEGQNFTCEYKYDGERAQIHYVAGQALSVFSRNGENMSVKYPDLVEQIPRVIKEGVQSFVLDTEAVAYDRVTKKLLPFQELSKRKRKDVTTENITIRIFLFAFDLLYLNGKPLIKENLATRRQLLREHLQPVEGEFAFATSSDGSSSEEIQGFLEQSVVDGCEGLMVKLLEGPQSSYEPSKRSLNWLKLKKDYLSGIGDSLDLVVIGAYYGKGKRSNVYGAFLLACYNEATEEFEGICKIGTGFSEENLDLFYKELKELEITAPKGFYKVAMADADVWFEPKLLWEVLAADLTLSPKYEAAKSYVSGERGVSLRFPRFIRIREDKDVEDATTSEQVAELYKRQSLASSSKSKGGAEDEDDY